MDALNRDQALEALAHIRSADRVLASIRTASGRAYFAARNHLEAIRWFQTNEGWYYPGSERVEEI